MTAEFRKYTDLEVWKSARSLVKKIYILTRSFPEAERFILTAQLQRASISVPSNIAEGCGRNSAKDTVKFLFIARGSLYEIETQLYFANDLDYIDQKDLAEVQQNLNDCNKLLNGFINYFEKIDSKKVAA